ncbi:MAG: T9SS type A sorting domain-containing protein [Paludibacter sp.]|nr:T9SS type A sorting domain-containing protein [Paludibacter sp.]
MQIRLSFFLITLFVLSLNAQTILEADGPGNTYELINNVLAPGFDVVESPDCAHPEFGRHITEVWDSELNQYVFEFHMHVTPDNDRCINFDRQRMEIKTYDKSPANLLGVVGETITYKWKFRLPVGFKVSSNFTHLHQIKAVGGDADDPIFVLTARKGNPNKMELNYYIDSDLSAVKLTTANLSLFEGVWVEVTERIKLDNVNGTYSMVIKNVSTGATILSYSNNQMLTIRANNSFVRPKWGIYRSLLNAQDLRDEIVRFASFSIEEDTTTNFPIVYQSGNRMQISNNLPFGNAEIQYALSKSSFVKMELLDIVGKQVKVLINNLSQNAGNYSCKFDSSKLPDDLYIVRLQTDDWKSTAKMIVKN